MERFLRKINNLMYIYYITAKLAIFATDMLWESCSKLNFEQLAHSMSVENIASLAVMWKIYIKLVQLSIFLKKRSKTDLFFSGGDDH